MLLLTNAPKRRLHQKSKLFAINLNQAAFNNNSYRCQKNFRKKHELTQQILDSAAEQTLITQFLPTISHPKPHSLIIIYNFPATQ